MSYGKTKIILTLITAIILTIIALFYIDRHYRTAIVDIPQFSHQKQPLSSSTASSSPDSEFPIPDSLLLSVPFTPQAPTGNWDQLHNEACEEASSLMADAYFSGKKDVSLDPKYVESEIDKLTFWQQNTFGYYLDTTSAETAQMMEKVYDLKTKLVENFTADDIKTELAQNRLVIISENGRLLNNPFYKQPGPIHHMLVIKGYDGDAFITNDSGTKRGLNYAYDFKTIRDAAADWDHAKNTTDTNIKIAIIVWK